MRITRFLQLVEWGCNVPTFIRNPYSHFGRSTWAFLQEHFQKAVQIVIIHEKKGKSLVSRGLKLANAFLTSGTLEMTKGKDVLMVDDVKFEFEGYINFYKDGMGRLYIDNKFVEQFAMIDFVTDPKHRCIVRDIRQQLFEKIDEDFVVFFGWATKFTGVNDSRLIICDYLLLRETA